MNLFNADLYLLHVWLIAEVLIGIWMFKAKPDKKITEKYPKKVINRSQRPFGKSWTKYIDNNDLNILQKYQHRIMIFYLSTIIFTLSSILWSFLIYLLVRLHLF
jgi:hypothetical protein